MLTLESLGNLMIDWSLVGTLIRSISRKSPRTSRVG